MPDTKRSPRFCTRGVTVNANGTAASSTNVPAYVTELCVIKL